MLYEQRYCDTKYESETFIKKKLRNVVVVAVVIIAARSGDNVLEFLAQEVNVALAVHSHTWSASVANAAMVMHILYILHSAEIISCSY